jgi:hypothetical protein
MLCDGAPGPRSRVEPAAPRRPTQQPSGRAQRCARTAPLPRSGSLPLRSWSSSRASVPACSPRRLLSCRSRRVPLSRAGTELTERRAATTRRGLDATPVKVPRSLLTTSGLGTPRAECTYPSPDDGGRPWSTSVAAISQWTTHGSAGMRESALVTPRPRLRPRSCAFFWSRGCREGERRR